MRYTGRGKRRSRVIYMSPQGKPFNQQEAKRLRRDYDPLVLVCGHRASVPKLPGSPDRMSRSGGLPQVGGL